MEGRNKRERETEARENEGAGEERSNKCPPSRGAKAFLITLLPCSERNETKSALITFSYNFIGRLSRH